MDCSKNDALYLLAKWKDESSALSIKFVGPIFALEAGGIIDGIMDECFLSIIGISYTCASGESVTTPVAFKFFFDGTTFSYIEPREADPEILEVTERRFLGLLQIELAEYRLLLAEMREQL